MSGSLEEFSFLPHYQGIGVLCEQIKYEIKTAFQGALTNAFELTHVPFLVMMLPKTLLPISL